MTYILERLRRTLSLITIRSEGLLDPLYSKIRSNNDWHSYNYNLQVLVDNMDKSHMQYAPSFYPGRLTLFRVSNQPKRLHFDQNLGWGNFADQIEVHEVKGYHKNILREPYVVGLARRLERCMQDTKSELA